MALCKIAQHIVRPHLRPRSEGVWEELGKEDACLVFLAGMEENLFPHAMSKEEPGRLAGVGVCGEGAGGNGAGLDG